MEKTSIKITLLGQSSTGKSTIVNRLVKDEFTKDLESTIGACFLTLRIDNIKYDIWDTAGQERYLSIAPIYYRNTDIAILVYDISNIETIDRIFVYMDRLILDFNNYQEIIIIGNKLDLIEDDKNDDSAYQLNIIDKLLKKKFEKYSYMENRISFFNISAKSGYNCLNLQNKIKLIGNNITENHKHHNIYHNNYNNNLNLFKLNDNNNLPNYMCNC